VSGGNRKQSARYARAPSIFLVSAANHDATPRFVPIHHPPLSFLPCRPSRARLNFISRESEQAARLVTKKNLERILQRDSDRQSWDVSTYIDVTTFGSAGPGEGSKGSEPCLAAARHYFECGTLVEMRLAAPRQRSEKQGERGGKRGNGKAEKEREREKDRFEDRFHLSLMNDDDDAASARAPMTRFVRAICAKGAKGRCGMLTLRP